MQHHTNIWSFVPPPSSTTHIDITFMWNWIKRNIFRISNWVLLPEGTQWLDGKNTCENFQPKATQTVPSSRKCHLLLLRYLLQKQRSKCASPRLKHTDCQMCAFHFSLEEKPYLEPETSIYKRLFQLDDSKSLHWKVLFHQTSIKKWLFGVPGIRRPFWARLTKLINTDPKEHLVVVSKDICTSNSSREKSSLGRDGHQLWGRVRSL